MGENVTKQLGAIPKSMVKLGASKLVESIYWDSHCTV